MNLLYRDTRNFKNIKDIPETQFEEQKHICFTYSVQPKQRLDYYTQKGILRRRAYSTLPYNAQKQFLTREIKFLNDIVYYFEQSQDGRFHLHAYCYEKPSNMLFYMSRRYMENNIKPHQQDLQDRLLLVEITGSRPAWSDYCTKEQNKNPDKELYITDILKNDSKQLDKGVKIECNYINYSSEYKHHLPPSKRFVVEI